MPKSALVAGLDIGSNKIKILVAERKNGDPVPQAIYQGEEDSFGVRKGVVVDPDTVTRIIQILLNKAESEIGQRIGSVAVNFGGSHIFSTFSKGMVAVSRADQKVSKEDVERVIQAAKAVSLSSNQEIFDVYPKEFYVNGEPGTKEVVGMQGGRLEAEVLALGAFSPYKNNLSEAVLDADLHISDIIPSPLASASSVLSEKEKELGVALLDIGAGTSELAVFEEGGLIHLAVFPIGSANITNDIAIGLKTDIDTAEAIKKNTGTCVFRGKDKKEKLDCGEQGELVVSRKAVSRIVEARVSEIFGEVQKELKKISKQGALPAGIVLIGGGAKLPGTLELAKKELKLPIRMGKVHNILNVDNEHAYAVTCGLATRDFDSNIFSPGWSGFKGMGSITEISGGIGAKIKKFLKNFIP